MNNVARGLLVSLLIVLVCFVAYTFWSGTVRGRYPAELNSPAVGTSGSMSSRPATSNSVDVDKARERGARIGEKLAIATNKVTESAQESAITAKVKAKMALDDQVKARKIDVTTNGSTVTLEGVVGSAAEHDRAVALARETAGVATVIDRLVIHG